MAHETLRVFLDRVEGHLHGLGKADILREIESHVWDRAEAVARARGCEEPGPEDLRRAIDEMGEPSEIAVSYSGEKHLVPPKEYTAFWYFTGSLFAVHLSTLLLALVTKTRFNFFPFNVLPALSFEGAGSVFVAVSLAVQAFLFDAGFVVMTLFLLRRTFRKVELPNLTFRVETSTRASLFRAAFAAALGVALGVPAVRDTYFTFKLGPEATDVYTLFLPPWNDAAPWLVAFLGLSFLKDLIYAFLHERPATLGLDVATQIAGAAVCIWLFAADSMIGLPSDFPVEEARIEFFNQVMGRVIGLFLIVLAAMFAGRAVKRFMRLQQLWGEPEGQGL